MRTIAIGDIHGCSLALAALLETIAPQPDDRLIFMGDYVDRGPNSRGVLDLVIELTTRCEVIPLLGNHELLLLAALAAGESNSFWTDQCGGDECLYHGERHSHGVGEDVGGMGLQRPRSDDHPCWVEQRREYRGG